MIYSESSKRAILALVSLDQKEAIRGVSHACHELLQELLDWAVSMVGFVGCGGAVEQLSHARHMFCPVLPLWALLAIGLLGMVRSWVAFPMLVTSFIRDCYFGQFLHEVRWMWHGLKRFSHGFHKIFVCFSHISVCLSCNYSKANGKRIFSS